MGPPCFETVRWHVMKHAVPISMEQMEKFRQVSEDDLSSQAPNFRPIQELNGRQIYYCEDSVTSQTVEKEELMEKNEPLDDEDDALMVWRVVGIVFIALFIISCMVIGCLLFRFCGDRMVADSGKSMDGQKYQRTSSKMDATEMSPMEMSPNNFVNAKFKEFGDMNLIYIIFFFVVYFALSSESKYQYTIHIITYYYYYYFRLPMIISLCFSVFCVVVCLYNIDFIELSLLPNILWQNIV